MHPRASVLPVGREQQTHTQRSQSHAGEDGLRKMGVEHVAQSWLACLDLSLQTKPQCSRTRETRATPNVFWSLTLSRAESVLSTPPHPHSVSHTLREPPHQAQATAKGGLSGCRKVLPHPQLVTTAHKVWSQTLMIWDLANASHLHQCGTSFKATGNKL